MFTTVLYVSICSMIRFMDYDIYLSLMATKYVVILRLLLI